MTKRNRNHADCEWLEEFGQYNIDIRHPVKEDEMETAGRTGKEESSTEVFVDNTSLDKTHQVTRSDYRTELGKIPVANLVNLFNRHFYRRVLNQLDKWFFEGKTSDTENPANQEEKKL